MSWATDKALIIAKLSGYNQIPENRMPDDTAKTQLHKKYSLKYTGTGSTEYYAGNTTKFTHIAELKISYENNLASERDVNADLFITLQKAIASINGFKGFTDERKFEDQNNKQTIGTITFEIGSESSC